MSTPVYPVPNSVLIPQLHLQKHPEQGYFSETDRQIEQILSPFADGAQRPLATTIYYLLTPDEKNGVFHMNKSATMHVLHQGRAEYILITPPATPGDAPKIERKIMGTDIASGEVLQLLVPSGTWKMSRLLPADCDAAAISPERRDRIGCLITEVVFPGFVWEDHAFLTKTGLDELFHGRDDGKEWEVYAKSE